MYNKTFLKTFWKILVFEQNCIRHWHKTIGRIVKTAFQVSTGTFYETLFCEKSLPFLVWILLEKIAKFPQINVVSVVATAFYLLENKKNTVRRKTSLFFRKNTIFKQFWVVSQFFWISGQQKFGIILGIASFFVSQKATGGRKFYLESFFGCTLDFWAKKNQIVV